MVSDKKKKEINFKTLWVRFDNQCTEKHQLFIKEHSIRNQLPEHPRGKTLFVLNIPPYATTESVKNAFSEVYGAVDSVTFSKPGSGEDLQYGFKTSYVVFVTESGLKKALACNKDHVITLSSEKLPILTGLQKYIQEYNDSIPDEAALKKEIEDFMKKYDKDVAKKLEEEKKLEETQDDGWTTVTGRKKRGKFAMARKESVIEKVKHKDEERKQKKQLLNFYTFQIREAKKQNLVELRKKFELDKKKLQEIKSKRSFKPF